jgi:hypothetical protein
VYVVEVVMTNRVVERALRTTDYDLALDTFDAKKKTKVREVRLVKVVYGVRAVLKYVQKHRK